MANANKKHQALQRLKEEVNKKNTELAFVDVMGYGFIGDTLSSGINADDTWTSKLADDQATEVKTEVNHLAGVFRKPMTRMTHLGARHRSRPHTLIHLTTTINIEVTPRIRSEDQTERQ